MGVTILQLKSYGLEGKSSRLICTDAGAPPLPNDAAWLDRRRAARDRRQRADDPDRLREASLTGRPARRWILVEARADPVPPDQPERDGLDGRSPGARRRGRRLRREHVPDEHGRHRRAVSDARAVSLSQHVPAARPRSVRRRRARGARAKDSRGRPLRSEQDAEAGLRRTPGMVLHARERRAGHLQRPLLDVHQRQLLPRARADDSRRRRSNATRSTGCSSTCSAIPSTDYSGVPMGPCHCEACQTRYRARYGRPVPAAADADYRAFMADSSREVAATIAELIHRKRPGAAFLTYIKDHTDGIMSESNTAVGRALPLWPYSASDNVSRSLGSEPDKMAINLAMSFVDFPWRYAHVPQAETALRLYQNIAHGAPPAVVVSGPMASAGSKRPPRREADLRLARAARGSLRRAEERGPRPAAGDGGHRVVSRLLPAADRAAHPVRRVREPSLDGRRPARFDLVIAPEAPPAELERYVRDGGRLLVGGTTPPPVPVGDVAGQTDHAGILAHPRSHGAAVVDRTPT